ncbi:sensory neuron membrane protein 1-like [Culicoides brevitarsis]|uniref:sensory neuron membrane protein 1-like n=1 Tax=Culicoides brevitarsis TaxID=469753 RepID=UPI00307C5B94
MENPALELEVISKKQEDEKKEVIEPAVTQALVDEVDAGLRSVKVENKEEDKLDGIRRKVALKPSPLLYGKKEVKKRDKALTLWAKIWRRIRYALPVLLIVIMIAINQSIHKRETNQKKPHSQIDYERLFQVLEKDTPLLKEWQMQEIVRRFYVFNWTNSEEIGNFPSVKPNFQEVGPFVFDEMLKKIDLAFDANGNQVSFGLERTKIFNREASVDDLEVKVISAADSTTLSSISEVLYGSFLTPVPYFYHQNITSERKGLFKVFTGNDKRETMNQLVDRAPITLGEVWSTLSTPDFTHPLQIYSPDTCLSVSFNDIQLTEGARQWASSCIEMESQTEKCHVVKTVNRCRGHSAPLVISFPHFFTDKNYEYDETITQNVAGLKADKKQHRPYVRFELKTGKLLEKRMRLQFNYVYKVARTGTEIVMPLFWYEETLLTERSLS